MASAYLQIILSGLSIGGVYALVAFSFSLTFTTTKTLNFSQGEVVGFGAFVGVAVLGLTGVSALAAPGLKEGLAYLAALAASGVVMGAVGILLFLLAVRPFTGKPGMNWVMSTIGFGIILQSLGLAIWGPAPVMVASPFGSDVIRIADAGVRPQEILIFGTVIALVLALDLVYRRTTTGKVMRAVAFDPDAASLMGIDTRKVMIATFAFSSALAGIAGVLIAPISSASIFMGLGVALKSFSGAMIGGLNNPRGCICGGFMLGLLETGVAFWEAQWREIVVFGLIILVLALRPNGLFGAAAAEKV